ILQQNATQSVGTTGIAVAHGMAILVGVYAFGHISGGHFNPAVTFGMLVTRRIRPGGAISYWVAQLVGATLGAYVLCRDYGGPTEAHLGVPTVSARVAPLMAMRLGGLIDFLPVIVIFRTAVASGASD